MEIFSAEDILTLVKDAGYILGHFIVMATVFAETGFLIGFVLPGDSLLFISGLAASQGFLNIYFILQAFLSSKISSSVS